MNKNEDLKLSQNHQIVVNNMLGSNIFCKQFLKYSDIGYELYLLGKNGEPKKNIEFKISLTSIYTTKEIQTTLISDDNGKVTLGKLHDITKITSSIREKGDIKATKNSWEISNNHKLNLPKKLKFCEGDNLFLPFLSKEFNNRNISFTKNIITYRGSSVISNEFKKLKLVGNSLRVDNLERGNFILEIGDLKILTEIEVFAGKHWKNDKNFIVTEDCLTNTTKAAPFIMISNHTIKDNILSLQICSDDLFNTRFHIFGFQFMPNNPNALCDDINNTLKNEVEKIIDINKSKNEYLSNKQLGDEYCYVLSRNKQNAYIGNTLERPQILLKRTKIRETHFKAEELQGEEEYEISLNYNEGKEKNKGLQRKSTGMSKLKCKKKQKMAGKFNLENLFDNFNSFLANPAIVFSNLKPDKNGILELPNFDFEKYSSLIIVGINMRSCINEILPLKKSNFTQKNLSQKSTLKHNHFYSIFRNSSQLKVDESFKIEDITSTEIQVIDSIPKLFNLQKELRQGLGRDDENNEGYNFWAFLKDWYSLDILEKHKKYDKYACHEVNLFLYFRDFPYFETYIKQFLKNKCEKTFIDYFLLNDTKVLETFVKTENLIRLNALEKILLITFLKENEAIEQAKEILDSLEDKNKTKSYDMKTFKKLFDIILNSKTLKESELGLQTEIDNLRVEKEQNLQFNNSIPIMQQQMYPPMQNYMQPISQQIPYMAQPMYQPNQMMQQQEMQVMQQQQMQMTQLQQQAMAPNRAPQRHPQYSHNGPPIKEGMGRLLPQNQMDYNNYMGGDAVGVDVNSFDNFAAYNDKIQERRTMFKDAFKNLETTIEYSEKHYYNQKDLNSSLELIQENIFWVELARHILLKDKNEPFLSAKFIYCNQNHSTMIAAMTFLSLPFEIPNHNYVRLEGKSLRIECASNSIIFSKEIKEGTSNLREDILITQRFFDLTDRYSFSEDEPDVQIEKNVEEYLIDKIYGCQVIITNCSVTQQDYQVLVEIPEGSIPVNTVEYTKSHTITLGTFSTKRIEYYFYFPKEGNYSLYPANISRNGIVVAVASNTNFEVLSEGKIKKLETIGQVLSQGSKQDILNFIEKKNILNKKIFNCSDIYYLLSDESFFLKVTDIFRKRKFIDWNTWSFSLLHGNIQTLKEFLNISMIHHNQKFRDIKCFENSLISINNIRFYEYSPLVNSRVHLLHADKCNILNEEFQKQYTEFIEYLVEVPEMKLISLFLF